MPITVTNDNFESIVANEQLVVIDFWAPWCAPCRALTPVIEELAQEYDGKVVIGKCDTDENNDIAAQFGVCNIPMLVFLKNGELKDSLVGTVPKAKIAEIINKNM